MIMFVLRKQRSPQLLHITGGCAKMVDQANFCLKKSIAVGTGGVRGWARVGGGVLFYIYIYISYK
mgnify:CR=1 FL=1